MENDQRLRSNIYLKNGVNASLIMNKLFQKRSEILSRNRCSQCRKQANLSYVACDDFPELQLLPFPLERELGDSQTSVLSEGHYIHLNYL